MDGQRRHGWLAIALVSLALGACAGGPTFEPLPSNRSAAPARPPNTIETSADARNTVADLAMKMIGVPYRYGGADPRRGFDCSGLVFYTYTSNGIAVPRTSQEQFKAARKSALTKARQGDLVFFQDQEKLSHVGIYLGDGLFVHAPSSGNTVSVASLDTPYYQRQLVGVGRLLPN
jgi:cell wall-associated NlpC family hydrolase